MYSVFHTLTLMLIFFCNYSCLLQYYILAINLFCELSVKMSLNIQFTYVRIFINNMYQIS